MKLTNTEVEYSNIFRCCNFLLNWFDCAVPPTPPPPPHHPSSHGILGGMPAGWAASTVHIGGFHLSEPPVNLMCCFHLTLRKPIFHLLLLLWREERDEKATAKAKEKIHQCHPLRARSPNARARAVPAGVILQSVAAPWECEKQLLESHWTPGSSWCKLRAETSESSPRAKSKSEERLSPLGASGREGSRQEVSDMCRLGQQFSQQLCTHLGGVVLSVIC